MAAFIDKDYEDCEELVEDYNRSCEKLIDAYKKEYILRLIKETREELDQLEKQMKEEEKEEEKEDVGFFEDVIFLLSKDEYKKYKGKIPTINCRWWLRDAGNLFVDEFDNICRFPSKFNHPDFALRPALKLKGEYNVGERIVLIGFPWVVIDKNLAIAEVPIWFSTFDNVDGNCYRDSYAREYLKKWLENRSEALNVNRKEF